jgi:hypothetical protein
MEPEGSLPHSQDLLPIRIQSQIDETYAPILLEDPI